MAERKLGDINLDIYKIYDPSELLDNVTLQAAKQFREGRQDRAAIINEVLRLSYGETSKQLLYFSPSVIANCLLWAAYEALGFKPSVKPVRLERQSMMGSASHWMYLKELAAYGMTELQFRINDPRIAGRMDFLFQNPVTYEFQIFDFKFVGNFVFRKITREGLPPELKLNKKNYNPGLEARKQLLLYMYAAEKFNLQVGPGAIIYFNRDTADKKICLVPWGEKEKYDVSILIEETKQAQKLIAKGELPSPSVKSPHVCKSFCPHLVICEYGIEFGGGKARQERVKRPPFVRKKAEEKRQRDTDQMIKMGIVQPSFLDGVKPVPTIPSEVNPNDFDTSILEQISDATGGEVLARSGRIYQTPPSGPITPEILPKEPDRNKADLVKEEEIYLRGDHELPGRTCGKCGKTIIQSVRLIHTNQNGSQRISIDKTCPSHGLLFHEEKTVEEDQLVNS